MPVPTSRELATYTLAQQRPVTYRWSTREDRLALLTVEHQLDVDMVTDLEFARRRRDLFAPDQSIDLFLNSWHEACSDLGVMLSMRYEGGNPGSPFVEACALSRPVTDPMDIAAVAAVVRERFGPLRPAYLRWWSPESAGAITATSQDTSAQRAEDPGNAPDRSRRHFPHQELGRARELAAVRNLVEKGQAQGILVYAGDDAVGWCHFGRADELPVPSEESVAETSYTREPSTDWVITCFTTRMDHRRQGVATTALTAAVAAIKSRGGGWIEGVPWRSPTTTRPCANCDEHSGGVRPRWPTICETPGHARRSPGSGF